MRIATQIICLLTLGGALWGSAQAQEAPRSDPWRVSADSRPTAPDVYLLPDENGKLRQVLGFRYENFLRVWNGQTAEVAQPPRYVLDVFKASGAAVAAHAELHIELRITTQTNGWVDVPLELPDFILQSVDIHQATEGECLVFDSQQNGHVVWLQGQAGKQRTVVLQGATKITTATGKSLLEIAPPHATISRFSLTIPTSDIEFEASPDVRLTVSAVGDQTKVVLSGRSSPLRLQWNQRHETASDRATTLETVGAMTVEVDGRRALYSASLRINSFGNPLELLEVRLPGEARSTHVQVPTELEAVVTETEDEVGRIVEIRPQRSSGEPWVLQLSAEQPFQQEGAESLCTIGGFEVVGAVHQSGQLKLVVEDELQAYFDLEGNMEQVPLEEASEQQPSESATAAFAYSRFPWELKVHTLPEQRRVNVQPRYELQINPDEARLQVEFDYQFSGANTFAVRVDLRGWQLSDEPLESGGAVDANRYVVTQEGLLVLPLVNPDVQRARIALVVRRPVELGAQSYPLPEALGGFVLPGELTVQTDASLQVTTDLSSLEGLGAVNTTFQEADKGNNPLVFRTFLSQAALDVEITLRERQVAVDVDTLIEVESSELIVQQLFEYDVKYRPLTQFLLWVPRELSDKQSLEARLDGKKVFLDPTVPVEDGIPEDIQAMVVALPRPLQQPFQLEIAYRIPYSVPTLGNPVQVVVPLVLPADLIADQPATIEAKQPRRVGLSQSALADAWSVEQRETSPESGDSLLQLQGGSKQSTLPLVVRIESLRDLQNAILERAWLQSWVVGNRQQDRAVFQFRSPHSQVHIELPPSTVDQPLEVLLDGKPIVFQESDENRISVALPGDSPRPQHVLELRYLHEAKFSSSGNLRTELPKLVCRPVSVPVFWQLALPRGWQVIRSPEAMASEFWLGWKQLRWGRQPTRSQADLEQWSGASVVPPPPPSTSQYVYSAFDIPAEVEVIVARQVWLVGAATLVVFGLGLVCVYTPVARKIYFWLAVAVALLALLFVYPELTLLVGQAVFWGGAMTMSVIVLRRAFGGRSDSTIWLPPSAAQAPSASATESWAYNQRITADVDEQPTVVSQTSGSES